MNSFEYRRDKRGIMLKGSTGDVRSLAAEIGYMTHELYSTLMRQNPPLARAFKHYVIQAMTSPDTPTWEVSERRPGQVEILVATPKKGATE